MSVLARLLRVEPPSRAAMSVTIRNQQGETVDSETFVRSLPWDVDRRPITRDDVVFCHKKLDELGAPRLCDAGQPLSLRWRLIALTRNGA